ncbi:MAG: leucyl/phenylalanyl-tRNA--protein transferase [Lentisphaeria bacterium]|nr:leucyl/phenylalanyl-tRNA--protein transferase [Lentisphaeria bacterium]
MCAESVFPPPENADENGIVAVSRTIDTGLLKDAYMHGIFPWPFGEEYDVIPWCAPLERGVLMLEDFHIPRSLVREMKKMDFSLRIDHDFPAVIRGCARALRKEAPGTWITSQVIDAYCEFHKMGYAHSFETYDSQGELVGGLYGISIGRIFCGESMFYKRSGASKFAFVKMADVLKAKGVVLVDTQMVTSVTASFGAVEIPSADYIRLLEKYRGKPLKFRELDASE